MNKIREAVIELDGKWPTKNKKDRYLLLCINSVGQVSTGQYDTGPSSKPCPIYWQVVGTRDEFNNEWDALISEGYVFGQGKPYKPETEWSGEGLPPIGLRVNLEYKTQKQGVAEMVDSRDGMVVWWNQDRQTYQHDRVEQYKAKPIQSPRDRAIEAADKAVSEHANFYCSVGETLWRAGLLRIPEDD